MSNLSTLYGAIAIATAATFAPTSATAADLMVPLPYLTIQSAIDAASIGDTVYLAPGTYSENISLGGKNISVRAFNTHFDTIIDGGQYGPVVTFSGTESSQCQIRDLILQNGRGSGIEGNSTLATIQKCTIRGNLSTGNGGGVSNVSGKLKKCTITYNQAANGGGISGCDGLIDSCVINNNKATSTGGGVYNCPGMFQYCQISFNEAATAGGGINMTEAILLGNLIQGNTVTTAGPIASPVSFGGGINDFSGTMTLNLVLDNASNGDGGGIANSTGLIQNNIITQNAARRGGGLASCSGRIENNTIWGNNAISQAGGCFDLGSQVANCIIFSNSAPANPQWAGSNVPTYSCVENWTGGQPDIITAAPQLENPANGKFNIAPTSPCVDAGKFIPGLTMDFEAQPRPFDGTPVPRGDGSDIDIGADEVVIVPPPPSADLSAVWDGVKVKYKGKPGKIKGKLQGTFLVNASGNDKIETPFAIQFFLSYDAVFDATDRPVGKYYTVKKLKPRKAKKAKCKVKLPVNETVTGQFLIGVADIGNDLSEPDETNNMSIYGPLP